MGRPKKEAQPSQNPNKIGEYVWDSSEALPAANHATQPTPNDEQHVPDVENGPPAPVYQKGKKGDSARRRIREWSFTHTPIDPSERSKNGRHPGRDLASYMKPRMMEKLMLIIIYEIQTHGSPIRWDLVAHRYHPGMSGNAIRQRLERLRRELIAEGHMVSPNLGDPAEVRGYVRANTDPAVGDLTTTRKLMFTEPWLDPDHNLPDARNLVHNPGQKRKAGLSDDHPEEEDDKCAYIVPGQDRVYVPGPGPSGFREEAQPRGTCPSQMLPPPARGPFLGGSVGGSHNGFHDGNVMENLGPPMGSFWTMCIPGAEIHTEQGVMRQYTMHQVRSGGNGQLGSFLSDPSEEPMPDLRQEGYRQRSREPSVAPQRTQQRSRQTQKIPKPPVQSSPRQRITNKSERPVVPPPTAFVQSPREQPLPHLQGYQTTREQSMSYTQQPASHQSPPLLQQTYHQSPKLQQQPMLPHSPELFDSQPQQQSIPLQLFHDSPQLHQQQQQQQNFSPQITQEYPPQPPQQSVQPIESQPPQQPQNAQLSALEILSQENGAQENSPRFLPQSASSASMEAALFRLIDPSLQEESRQSGTQPSEQGSSNVGSSNGEGPSAEGSNFNTPSDMGNDESSTIYVADDNENENAAYGPALQQAQAIQQEQPRPFLHNDVFMGHEGFVSKNLLSPNPDVDALGSYGQGQGQGQEGQTGQENPPFNDCDNWMMSGQPPMKKRKTQ